MNKLTKALYNARYNYRKYYHIENDRIKYSREIDRLVYKIQEMKNG